MFKGFNVTGYDELILGGNMKRDEWLQSRLHWSTTMNTTLNEKPDSLKQGTTKTTSNVSNI